MQGIVVAAPGGIVASVSLAACAALALGWAWRGRAPGGERRACPRGGAGGAGRRAGRGGGAGWGGPRVGEGPDCGADVPRPPAAHVPHGRRRPMVAAAAVAVILLCMAWLVGAPFPGSRLSAGATDLVRH